MDVNEVKRFPVYVVNSDDEAALSAVKKLCEQSLVPGSVVPLTAAEFKAFQRGVIRLDIE